MRNDWMITGLIDLGIVPGDVLLVHSSMKGLGQIDGGPDAVIAALLAAVGDEGTVLFPTLTGAREDGPEHPPRIELATTPCWTGLIPETARQHPQAIRSIHPTHSIAAIGNDAAEWASGHERGVSPCDQASPYYRLMDRRGKILLLGGVTHESNTSMHCVEELADVPYHLHSFFTDGVVILPDGPEVTVRNRLHNWENYYESKGLVRDFTLADQPLQAAGIQRKGQIGRTVSTLIDAAAFREFMVPRLRANELYLHRKA